MGEFTLTFGKFKGETIENVAKANPRYVTWLAGSVNKFSLQKDVKAIYEQIQSDHPDCIVKAKEYVKGKCPNCLGDCKVGCSNARPTRNYHYHPYGKR